MSLDLSNLLGRLFRRSASAPARRPRLGLEPLEAREVPAVVVTVTKISDATEGGGSGLVRFTRDSALFSALTVNYTVGGTATQGADYGPLGGSVTFDIGVQSVDVALVPVADNVVEGDEAALFVVVGGFGYEPGTDPDDRATVIIHDQPVVTVAKVADATEGGANGTFRFTRTGDTSGPLTANYSVGGTATAGTDYTALSGSVMFAAGSAFVDVVVLAQADKIADPNEVVSVTLSPGVGHGVSGSSTAVINIVDVVDFLPVAFDAFANTSINSQVAINVLNYSSDLDGDTLSIARVSAAANGRVDDIGGGIIYIPYFGF